MRIGIAVKPGLVEARETLVELSAVAAPVAASTRCGRTEAASCWPMAAGTRSPSARICRRRSISSLVLGGDGTLLAMAKAIAESGRDIPILAVNFGSLGFLTEITRPEIFTALEAVIDGRATHDLRMMLRASATRRGQSRRPRTWR